MDKSEMRLTFPAVFKETLRKFGNRDAYAFVGETPKTYDIVNKEIKSVIAFLEKNGICPGDKVAILSLNMPNWAVAYFSITFMGAVVVPILPDFSSTEVANVLEHSGAKAIFISGSLMSRIEGFKSENMKTAIQIEDFSLIYSQKGSSRFDISSIPVKDYVVEDGDIMLFRFNV